MSTVSATFDGSPSDDDAVILDSVTKSFGSNIAVKDLSLRIPRGHIVSLLGPNGAGKTTTIEMCEGFVQPSSGSVTVLGLNPSDDVDQLRERLGIMLQGGGGYSGATVIEQLKLSAKYFRNPHDPEWLIDVLGLGKVRTTTYRRLSGGQQQRLSLALALLPRPELVFLDEPTAGMDAQARHLTWDLIRALRRDGATVVLTTHLLDEAETLSDHVFIIDKGELKLSGSPQQLIADAANDKLTFSTDKALDIADMPDHLEVMALGNNRYRIPLEPTPDLVAELSQLLAERSILLRKLTVASHSLEDVFLDVTGNFAGSRSGALS